MDEIEKNKELVKKIKDTIRHISQYLQQNGFMVSESNTILNQLSIMGVADTLVIYSSQGKNIIHQSLQKILIILFSSILIILLKFINIEFIRQKEDNSLY